MFTLHHTDHGFHEVAVLGYLFMLLGFALGGIWIVLLAETTAGALATGVAALGFFVAAAAILTVMTKKMHHDPLVPENTTGEVGHYLHDYRD
ncbi:hypothetical protein GIY30_05000 [Gordonia sp. HNM0687]|uniref:Uncharacterized protein n=1 Tax=Gordonia mangrovi TaxID=2665643 RepID=A0A6L7GLG9_9ACTN|nr:hypothetical protein [Gordonia mangrovi]MXP20716.1 hypothetical protein [Gordonia mangrovi]UVF78713.1 hypothetical protein NWF22_02240 [Gordonia mangrovi]